jgi:hypothetical protein
MHLVFKCCQLHKFLDCSVDWNEGEKIDKNYEHIGLLSNPNAGFGRQTRADVLTSKRPASGQQTDGEETEDTNVDDDLTAAMGKTRSSGKAPPKRPTPRQRQSVARLIEAHGGDIDRMSRDRKLNPMQQTSAELRRLIEACEYWKEQSGVDFRVPNKSGL